MFVSNVNITQRGKTVRCATWDSFKTQPSRSQTQISALNVIANLTVHGMVENVTEEQLKEKMEKQG